MWEYIIVAIAVGSVIFIGADLYIHYRFKKSITEILKDSFKILD